MSEPLKVGDKVQVINGPDEGRVGKVTQLFDHGRIVVCKFGQSREEFHPSDLVRVSAIQPEPEPSTGTLFAADALIDRIKHLEADRDYWKAKAKPDAAPISLRNHFAGLAMSGWVANTELGGFEDHYIAGKAYQIADAMLKARA